MKTYFENGKCVVTLNETVKKDEFTEVIDLKKIKDVIKGLELLGKEVYRITLAPFVLFADMDTPYYRRTLGAKICEEAWRYLESNVEKDVVFKKNRLYFTYDSQEIVCPLGLCNLNNSSSSGEDELLLYVYYR